jgi:ubiquinol-cytochrome c reductase cytochrome b subunit
MSTPDPAAARADHEVVAGRFSTLGAGVLILAVVAVVTGVVLLPFYSATAEGAHRSVVAMQASLPLRFLQGVHHWASALLIVLGAALLVYGLFTHAYRRPLGWAWVALVGLLQLFVAFQLTGHLLPWDTHAVSSAAIELGIAENVPVIGPMQARLLRGGGDAVSPKTLTTWYVAHVALLPLALVALAALYVAQVRRAGHERLWQRCRRVVLATLAVVLVLGLAVPAPLGPVATPADYTSYSAPPEWYVLALHTLLNLAQRLRPDLAFLGTVVIPGLAIAWLLLLPWLDRRRAGEPCSTSVRGLAVLGVVGGVVATLMGADHMAALVGTRKAPPPAQSQGGPATVQLDPALVRNGKAVYDKNGCAGCHKIAGQGNSVGPPLDGVGTRQPDLDWQIRHLKNPAAVVKGSTMPPYKQLSEADLKALATYLLSLR